MSAPGRTQVLILGGGFGGLYAALEMDAGLARDSDVEVTLVNRQNFSLFTPMLHEVATSDLDMTHIVNPLRKLLKYVQFFHGEVEHIDLIAKRVTVVHGSERHSHELRYDYLILALGSMANFFGLPELQHIATTPGVPGEGQRRSGASADQVKPTTAWPTAVLSSVSQAPLSVSYEFVKR